MDFSDPKDFGFLAHRVYFKEDYFEPQKSPQGQKQERKKFLSCLEDFYSEISLPAKEIKKPDATKATASKSSSKESCQKYFPCPKCDKAFKRKEQLGGHISRGHKMTKNFKKEESLKDLK